MGYRALQFACGCGQAPDRILEVGFTSDGDMVVHFWCSLCQRVEYICQPLEECHRGCPPPDSRAEALVAAEDSRFLESLGIAVPE